MNFDELCRLEQSFMRASLAVRQVAGHALIDDLFQVERIVQEVRHAGGTLCIADVSPELKARVIERLLVSLFGAHHAQL